ncbi:MAG: glutamine hydrolyzing CTP synthase [Thermoplasmata archaeon]
MMKYVIITGGVLSGLGKGITTSSLGMLLRVRGLRVTAIKIDPYLNCDAGTMNPFQHGEVFVLDDGSEVDMDFGNYERFIDVNLTTNHNITTGKVYRTVIEKERRGDYLGNTVQIIPHITDEIKREIIQVGKDSDVDVTLVELGGTVGDIESMPFLEAVRQLSRDVGRENVIFIHTTLVPILGTVKEQKTKPTQHSVRELRAIGIKPDIVIARSEKPLERAIKGKISLFCDVPEDAVVSAPDVASIYEVPLLLEDQELTDFVLKRFGYDEAKENLGEWKDYLDRLLNPRDSVTIALVGKYTHLMDSYISHVESLHHAGAKARAKVNITWVESEDLENGGSLDILGKMDGILVPGGFGDRGIEGKIRAIRFARENKVPFLGICLGFQLATVEFSRHMLRMEGANSSEFDHDTPYPVVDLLPEQKEVVDKGATMRLGAHKIRIRVGSVAEKLYGKTKIEERHRHRYEINPEFIERIEKEGLEYTGRSLDDRRMEIAEFSDHPYFMASQFHPEFKSRPLRPSPLHYGLVRASLEKKRE